jgi:hypothetical protein
MSTLAATNLKNPSSGSNNIVLGTDGSSTLSTAKVTTLADSAGANTSTPAAIAAGIAKAWVNFNGTGTVAIRASYNVSSITDNGVGDYTVNLTTAMVDANYIVSLAPNSSGLNSVIVGALHAATNWGTPTTYTTSAVRIISTGNGSSADAPIFGLAIFR